MSRNDRRGRPPRRGPSGGPGRRQAQRPKGPLAQLVAVAGPRTGSDLAGGVPDVDAWLDAANAAPLRELLGLRNGFWAFEGALRVRHAGPGSDGMGVAEWNMQSWHDVYEIGGIAFAEDTFMRQFILEPAGAVGVLDLESGDYDTVALSLSGWADAVLADYEMLCGWPIAHAWQEANGAIPAAHRLMAEQPFVLGGEFTIDNLVAVPEKQAAAACAALFGAIRDLPDGTEFDPGDWLGSSGG